MDEIAQPTTHRHAVVAIARNPRVFNWLFNKQPTPSVENEGSHDRGDDENIYTQTASWFRKAVLDAYEGLVSTASFMIGIETVRNDAKTTLLLSGTVGLVSGASTMVIKKFLSVKTKYDIELAQMQRKHTSTGEMQKLPNPYSAAFASAVGFTFGASVPLLGAAFLEAYELRLGVVVGVVSLGLIVLGGLIAVLGKSPWLKSSFRFLIAGLLAVAVTYGLTLLADRFFLIPNTL